MRSTIIIACLLFANTVAYSQQNDIIFLDSTTVKEFIHIIQHTKAVDLNTSALNVIEWKKPGKWVKKEDIPALIELIRSKQKCACIAHAYSSTMPEETDHSNVGGVAMDIIDYYRGKLQLPGKTMKKFGNSSEPYPVWYRCSRVDEERAKEIEQWWAKEKH